MYFCTFHWRTIVKVSLDGVRANSDVPFSASVSPGCTFFVVQKLRAWLHGCCSSHSRFQGWRRSWSARTLFVSAKISYVFHSCNRLYLIPSRYCSRDIVVGKNFRQVRRSRCCSSRRSSPAILCWTCWSSASGSSPEWMILYVCGSRNSRPTFRLCSRVLYPAARLQKEALQIFCNPQCCDIFHRNSSNRSVVPKMILRLGFVDLVDHVASSILLRHVVRRS